MANPTSTVSDLVIEVCNILKLDNVDPRANEWLGMAFNDICQQVIDPLFHEVSVVTVGTGDSSVALSEQIGVPVAAVFVNGGKTFLAQQLSPNDYSRTVNIGSAISSTAQPKYWTIQLDGSAYKLYITPPSAGGTEVTLIWAGNYVSSPPSGSTLLNMPYHFEGALIWRAAFYGAIFIRPELQQLCDIEFQEAMMDMQFILGYHPDTFPTMRSVRGPYIDSGRQPQMARFEEPFGGA